MEGDLFGTGSALGRSKAKTFSRSREGQIDGKGKQYKRGVEEGRVEAFWGRGRG